MPRSKGVALNAGTSSRSPTSAKDQWLSSPIWSPFLNSRVPVLVLCAWLLLYAGRPFSLGFYSDDWSVMVESTQGTVPFSSTRFGHFVGIGTAYAARPVAGLIVFLFSSIGQQNPFAYQAFCALFALVAALSLRAWLKSLLAQRSAASSFSADLAAIAWLTIPWSLATTAWASCAMAVLPAQIFFTESARLMATAEGRGVRRLFLAATLLLASYLTYETFYFQGILVGAFYWLRDRRTGWLRRLSPILIVCVVQAASIALNRWMKHAAADSGKSFNSAWQSLFWTNLRLLPKELLRSAGPLGTDLTILLGVIVLAAIASAVTLRWNSERQRLSGGLRVIALGLASIPVMCLLYALASYGIAFSGLTSRTLSGISWAFAVLLYGLLCLIFEGRRRPIVVTGAVATLLFVVLSGMAQQLHTLEFATVWRKEKAILQHVPVEQVRELPKDSEIQILYIGPSYYGDIPIFAAVWELTGAVFSLPALREWQRPGQHTVHIQPATTLYNWSWDGAELTQECPGYWKQRFAGKALYVWNYDQACIFRAEKGFHWNPTQANNGSEGPAGLSGGATTPAAATLLKIDTSTQGNWGGVYGGDGYSIPGEPRRNPTYAEAGLADPSVIAWGTSVRDARALQKFTGAKDNGWWIPIVRALGSVDRSASAWSSESTFTIDVNLTDGYPHEVAVYCLDWDSGGVRAEKIDILDAATGAVLNTRTISDFVKGQYIVWNLRGHVKLQVTRTAGPNAVVSGLFFQ
jgi:hypothetical protein